jgi:hypothetical protein
VWYWRLRLFIGSTPAAWLVMGDPPGFVLVLLGAAVASAIWMAGSRVATFEARVRFIRTLRDRG